MDDFRESPRRAGIGLVVLLFLNVTFTTCACGHADWLSFPVNAFAFTVGWFLALKGRDSRLPSRFFAAAVCVLATVLFLKNVADILWLGHDALLNPG
jgi:hypothetical protein